MANHFGPYRLLRRIAAGGMGEVYLAVLEREGGFTKTVALKTMLPTVEHRESFAELFESEASVAAMLNHANIVQIFDHGVIEGKSYLTMELVEGPDLGSLIRSIGQRGFPPGVACEIGVQLCRALGHAHERRDLQGRPAGIVHGDISPANILISAEGQVKLADFGLARVRQVFPDEGAITGKYPYMSPEQAAGRPLTPASDLFSLGLVLYELLTGSRAFEPGESPDQTLAAIRANRLIPARKISPELPVPLAEFLDRALAASMPERFPGAREMSTGLSGAGSPCGPEGLAEFIEPHTKGPSASRIGSPEPTELAQKPVSPPARQRGPYLALAILFVVAWGAGLTWWAFNPQPAVPAPPKRPETREAASLRPLNMETGPLLLPEPSKKTRTPRVAPILVIGLPRDYQALLDHRPVPGGRIAIRRRGPHLVRLRPKKGKTPEVSLRLAPSGRPDGAWNAAVRATPWMKLSLNNQPTGQTPKSRLLLPPGRARLALSRGDLSIDLQLDIRKPD